MNVFMAGASSIGVAGFQLLIMDVSRLSQIPLDILAKVLALIGAIKKMSAHFLNSACKMASPGFLVPNHSSSSLQIFTSVEIFSPLRKCCAALVTTSWIETLDCPNNLYSLSMISGTLIVATEPVAPIRMCTFWSSCLVKNSENGIVVVGEPMMALLLVFFGMFIWEAELSDWNWCWNWCWNG